MISPKTQGGSKMKVYKKIQSMEYEELVEYLALIGVGSLLSGMVNRPLTEFEIQETEMYKAVYDALKIKLQEEYKE
jgi:hypothetical protein